jgi:outer membrane protein TolC
MTFSGKDGPMNPTSFAQGVLVYALILASPLTITPATRAQAPQPTPLHAPAPAAPTVRRLTLEEARQLALANNKALELGRLNVSVKQFAASAAWRDYLPKLLGVDYYFHFNQDLGNVLTISRGSLGIVPGGITRSVAVFNQDSNLATIMLAQPITKLILVNVAVKLARADRDIAQAQLDKGLRDLLSGVAQAYYGLAGAQRIQIALELQIKLLEQVLAQKPLPELRVSLVEAQQGLAQVRSQVQELTQTLDSLLDLPPCTLLELVEPLPPDLVVHCAAEAAELAVTNNPDIREAEQGIAKAQAGLQAARMEYLPDVNIIGGFANQTWSSYIQPDIGYLGITATYTFWDWGKRKQIVRERQTQIALAHQNVRVTADKVRLEAAKAYDEYEQTRESYRLAGEMVQVRQAAEKQATEPQNALQAKGDTAKAQLEYMKAEIAYRVANAKLAGLIGQ